MGVCYPTYVSLLPFRYLKSASIQRFRALTYKFLGSEQLGLGLIGCSFPSAFLISLSTCLSSVRFDFYIIDPVPVAVVQSGLSTTLSPTSAINVIDVYIRLDSRGRVFTVTRHCFRVAPCQHEICSVLCSLRTSSRMVGRGYLYVWYSW